jgi:hypothetical protein
MGYYPFGKEFFSDLTHYVRSGDFIVALLRNAHNANEYAFAVGALSHYLGDSIGHSESINPATAIEFPHLEKKYGPEVTYEENPHAHVRTEFAFDIDMLSHHHLAPAAYLRHVGFIVPRRLLEVAFFETYGLRLKEVLGPERPAIRSYRTSVRSFIPPIRPRGNCSSRLALSTRSHRRSLRQIFRTAGTGGLWQDVGQLSPEAQLYYASAGSAYRGGA